MGRGSVSKRNRNFLCLQTSHNEQEIGDDDDMIFIGSLKAGFVTERSELGSCRAFSVQYPIFNEVEARNR